MTARSSLIALVLGVFCIGSACEAATQRPVSLAELAGKADMIVVGIVTGRTAVWNSEHTQIYTRTAFRITETLKGAPSDVVVVETLGGVRDGIGMMVVGSPMFRAGENDLVFLARDPRTGVHRVLGWEQGRFRIFHDPVTGRERVSRNFLGVTLLRGVGPIAADTSDSLASLDELKSAIRRVLGRY